jgi:REP element-mobilizing transposase RayT
MPRTARAVGGFCYHVLNPGNARGQVFHHEGDYGAFVRLIVKACARVRLLAFCLMPNHFHLALWPSTDAALIAFMHWLLTTHAGLYQKQYRGRSWGRGEAGDGLRYWLPAMILHRNSSRAGGDRLILAVSTPFQVDTSVCRPPASATS